MASPRRCVLFGLVLWLFAHEAVSLAQQPNAPEYVPNQLLVQFTPGVDPAERAKALEAVGATSAQEVKTSKGGLAVLPTDLPVPEAIARLQDLPGVEFAEPNWIVRHYATSNDPYYTSGQLWGMYGTSTATVNQYGSQAGEAWANGFTGSSGVYVAIIDTGIDFNHQDLSANIWTNPYDPVDGVDNDGNGKIDDTHGWDFYNNNNSIYDDPSIDRHGTHVAGTIGGRGGNGIGVAGVNWNVTMFSAKFLGSSTGTGPISAAVTAVEYVTDLKTRHGMNIVATNNSWGGGGYSLALHQAIIRAAKANILFIAAAGNSASNNDSVANYPSNYQTDIAAGSETAASYDAVLAVASLTSAGARSSFSNYGAATVDIGAPGSGIYSSTPLNNYASLDGTSMATPHVTGAVALYKSINAAATGSQIKAAIIAQGVATPSMSGVTTSGKRLNVGDFSGGGPLPSLTINDVSLTEGNSGPKTFTFTATLSASSPSDVGVNFATANGTATSGSAGSNTQTNSSPTTIPDSGAASPYPSNLTLPAGLGAVTQMTATLSSVSHTFPSDIDVLLVGPGGQNVVLISDMGGGLDIVSVNLTFADGGTLLSSSQITSGTYAPSNDAGSDSFPAPAPAGAYGSTLSAFNGLDPAGTWKLFVVDDAGQDLGTIGSWSLTFTVPGTTGDYQSASGTVSFPPGTTTRQIQVTVNGDAAAEAAETFNVNLSSPTNATIGDAQGIGTILDDDFAFTDPTLDGTVMIKAVHIIQLRTRIDLARAARGLGNYAWTAAPQAFLTVIQAVHIIEMREALRQVYVAAGQAPPSYTDPTVIGMIRAVHLTQLRVAAMAAP